MQRDGCLIRRFVVAGLAAGFAIHQAIGANANIEHGLAETAVLLALATILRLFTLRATVFRGAGSGAHGANVARSGKPPKMTLVIGGYAIWLAEIEAARFLPVNSISL